MWDDLMRLGWPAIAEEEVDGWVARFSEGVTRRANAVLPSSAPADLPGALERVERLYRVRGLPATFQVGPWARPEDLDRVLEERGYAYGSPTAVQVASAGTVLRRVDPAPVGSEPRVTTVADAPDADWLDLWWAVDGRGDDRALGAAVKILSSGVARYATVREGDTVVAVGRVALVGEWGGLYCLAVRPGHRRRGHGAAVLRALVDDAARHGVVDVWLQVRAENETARGLYQRAGFTEAARYHYRTLTSDGR